MIKSAENDWMISSVEGSFCHTPDAQRQERDSAAGIVAGSPDGSLEQARNAVLDGRPCSPDEAFGLLAQEEIRKNEAAGAKCRDGAAK